MTDYAGLIAEAEKEAAYQETHGGDGVAAKLYRRLAAALRECAPTEGWSSSLMVHTSGNHLQFDDGMWQAFRNTVVNGEIVEEEHIGAFSTAAAAMAALDAATKSSTLPPPSEPTTD